MFFFSQTENVQQLKQLDAFATKLARKYLPAEDQSKIKRFVKAFYEIRYNSQTSKYFPNFDDFDDEQMKAQIAILLPHRTFEFLDSLSSSELKELFFKSISREVNDLEKDMLEVFS